MVKGAARSYQATHAGTKRQRADVLAVIRSLMSDSNFTMVDGYLGCPCCRELGRLKFVINVGDVGVSCTTTSPRDCGFAFQWTGIKFE